jgi:hypothetical protein
VGARPRIPRRGPRLPAEPAGHSDPTASALPALPTALPAQTAPRYRSSAVPERRGGVTRGGEGDREACLALPSTFRRVGTSVTFQCRWREMGRYSAKIARPDPHDGRAFLDRHGVVVGHPHRKVEQVEMGMGAAEVVAQLVQPTEPAALPRASRPAAHRSMNATSVGARTQVRPPLDTGPAVRGPGERGSHDRRRYPSHPDQRGAS